MLLLLIYVQVWFAPPWAHVPIRLLGYLECFLGVNTNLLIQCDPLAGGPFSLVSVEAILCFATSARRVAILLLIASDSL